MYPTTETIPCKSYRPNCATIAIDAEHEGAPLPNLLDNINVWDMGQTFIARERYEKYDIFEFVRYVQLMQCSGGNTGRDLFRDPENRSVLDDYDFPRLIENCRGILRLGAKPHLKLGSVPLKYSSGPVVGGAFGMNVRPPDDYGVYYRYILALAEALVAAFGRGEVLTWRFGCMTEYDNKDWWLDASGDPNRTAEEYFKLYDYTAQALVDVLGPNVFVGAHAQLVGVCFWDCEAFIRHVGFGKNYANGGTGTPLRFLSASFYDSNPGSPEYRGWTPRACVEFLRAAAEKAGLKNLIYGVDEGRVLRSSIIGKWVGGHDWQLPPRAVGFTWQAACDAHMYRWAIDGGMDYFSSWSYLSGGNFDGFPTVYYHVARLLAKFGGARRVPVSVGSRSHASDLEVDALAGWNVAERKLYVMLYNFRNAADYRLPISLSVRLHLPQFVGKNVRISRSPVDDTANFFPEWVRDQERLGFKNDDFKWSQDSGQVCIVDPEKQALYDKELAPKYEALAQLKTSESTVRMDSAALELTETLAGNSVLFLTLSE